MCPVYIMQRLG